MIVEGDVVVSEVMRQPVATNTLFDALSASIAALSPGPRVAVLGFGAGGVVGPLRGMGSQHAIEGVDLSPTGEPLFREFCSEWAGDVTLTRGEAYAWLGRKRKPYDFILEDLSESHPEYVAVKPWISLDVLPRRIAEKLTPRGVVVFNLLPWPGTSWSTVTDRISAPFRHACVVYFKEYQNRLLIAGDRLPETREIGKRLRESLRRVRSSQADEISVRTWRR
jgi:spermidine synthase